MTRRPIRIALLGAGFTRNWGGWLASELVGELCGRVSDDVELLRMLKETRNFEYVLGDIRQSANRGEIDRGRFERLQQAVLDTFDEMNQMLATQQFEFNIKHPEKWLVRFLAEFDAIFTLNQDLLLELHYVPGGDTTENRKWYKTAYPGISVPSDWADITPIERLGRVLSESRLIGHDSQEQPIYKLHGSVNWRTTDGSPIVVIGSGKSAIIDGSPLLSGYFEEFQKLLSAGDTKLMVIGYSFSDDHVNKFLAKASLQNGLRTYLVNPAGLSMFDPPPNALITQQSEVFRELRPVGILTRPFRDAFLNDQLSFKSFQRFLKSES